MTPLGLFIYRNIPISAFHFGMTRIEYDDTTAFLMATPEKALCDKIRNLERYTPSNLEDHLLALREILQEIALLGLWRSKFFDKAAFYGGTALRILYGLDRFSEDLDFSLLMPMKDFDLKVHLYALQKEIAAFGFDTRVENPSKPSQSQIKSAFLKANTISQLLVIQTPEDMVRRLHRERVLKIKLKVDTDPPYGFETETRA